MFNAWRSRNSGDTDPSFEKPREGALPNYDDVVNDGGLATLEGDTVFVIPTGEGVRSDFRTITVEAEADAAINTFVNNAYLAARDHYVQKNNNRSGQP